MTTSNRSLDLALAAFLDIFGVTGFDFGATTSHNKGMCGGNEGVQWNIYTDNNSLVCRLGVNLEGMKYDNWPIARFIEDEMKTCSLLNLANINGAREIQISFFRDAWQAASRPPISEHSIFGSGIFLSELTEQEWCSMLSEAYQCLDPTRNRRARALRPVTLLVSGIKQMEVSSHLNIHTIAWKEVPPNLPDAIRQVSHARSLLSPIYKLVQNQAA